MSVAVRVACVWVTVAAIVCVTAAVGPRRPNDNDSGDSLGVNSVVEGLATCGTALLQELHTITDLVLGINNQRATLPQPALVVHDCSTLRLAGVKGSGVYQVFPFTFKVYCDMVKDGGGWTVIQRRLPQKVQENFTRGWSSYREGFGQLQGEMWLGLEALHQLTHSAHYELRVDMIDYELGHKYAHYQVFRVSHEKDGYRLYVANYSGNAGDALSLFHSGRRFSTFDRDQDKARNKSCALDKEGGWWFHACYSAHPNGHFPATLRRTDSKDIRWWKSLEQVLVLTHIEMKIRRRVTSDATVVTTKKEAGQNDDRLQDDEEHIDYEFDEYPTYDNYTGGEDRSDIPPWWLQVNVLE